jgi:inhibitor of cysteine peptidase
VEGEVAMEVGRDAAGSLVRVPVGTLLDVRVPENPTTGYRWAVVGEDGEEEAVLPLAEDSYEGGGAVGSSGTRLLRFRASRPGRASLHLVHRRPWEGDVSDADRFDLDVLVEQPGSP